MHADWQGSARLENGTDGSLFAAAAYSPYGYIYDAAGSLDASFTGQRQDIDNATSGGQYSFPNSAQNPIQGRWWTPDPAGLAAVDPSNPQSWNRYAYVGGDPLSNVDPSGLAPPTYHATGCGYGTWNGQSCVISNGIQSYIFEDAPYLYCALFGCSGGAPEMTIDGACGSYGCTMTTYPVPSAGDNSGGGESSSSLGPLPSSPASPPDMGGSSITSACTWDPACYWFIGMGNAFVNEPGKGLAIGLGSTAVGVVGLVAGQAAAGVGAVAPGLVEGAENLADTAAATAQDAAFQLRANPEFGRTAVDVLTSLSGVPGFPETAVGAAAAIGMEVADHWHQITGWFRPAF